MKYIRLSTTDPYYNLAVEEYLLRNTKQEVFMLWQNAPTVVIGKNQNAYAEVDLAYAAAHGIRVARRITGGGAVYHDAGNINYTFITSKAEEKSFSYFTRPIVEAFASLGVPLVMTGRNDLSCEGKKVSGNARYEAEGRILHHGTLLFDADTDTMASVLHPDAEKYRHRAIASHQSRVGALSMYLGAMSVSELISHVERFVLERTGAEPWSVPESKIIDALASRNASEEWILARSRYLTEYSITRKKKYPFGLVTADMTLVGDRITEIRISGDFFAELPIEGLETSLVGHCVTDPTLPDPAPYISGMTKEELSTFLLGSEP